jgi:HSP90 family molecular chaperone
MAKVSIIDVELGFDMSDIITREVTELSSKAQDELERTIKAAKEAAAEQEQKKEAKEQKVSALTEAMQSARQQLLDAGDGGVAVSQVLEPIKDMVPNGSAFTLRMKKILRDEGNIHALTRKKVEGVPHYVLIPFNQ